MAGARPSRGRPENKTPRHKKKAKNRRRSKPKGSSTNKGKGAAARRPPGPERRLDPSAADDAETRFIQPYQATKTYLCPGCNQEIPPGMGHMVAVPPDDPDLRRHWHRGCWNNRHNL